MAYKFEKVKSVEERLDNLEAIGVGNKLDVQQGHINALVGRAYNLEGRAAALEAADTGIKARLDTLEQSGGGSNIQLDPYLTETGKAADAGAVGAEIQEIYTNINDLDGRVGNLEQSGGSTGGGGSSGGALDAEFYIVMKMDDGVAVWTALEFVEQQMNITCKLTKHFVSTPPTTIAPPTVDADGDYAFDIYIVESTGIVYVSGALAGVDVVTLGALCFQSTSADKGWSDDIGNENGVYTVRSVGTYDGAFETIHLFVQNSNNEINMTKHQWEKIQKSFHKTILEIRLLLGWRIRLYPTFLGQNTLTKTPDYCYSALVWGSDQTARAWQAWANDGNIVLNNRVVAS